MKLQALELPTAKLSANQTQKRVLLLAFTLVLLTLIQLHLNDRSGSVSSQRPFKISFDSFNWKREEECDIFSGEWVENPAGPLYTNRTCNLMIDEQNCLKFGRTDEKFLKWRWKPDECELPLFDGVEFLEVVRGKSLAFVGDSVGRNQMQSLLCLLSTGVYAYDYGDTAGMTPLMKMHTLGHDFIPDPIHAGGLRYHGMAPLISHIYEFGFLEAVAIPQTECFRGALQFARTEGIIPAPEPTHAIAATIREALRCRETGEAKVILTAMCGHGHFDLAAYEKYLEGGMVDLSIEDDKVKSSIASIPHLATPRHA